MGPVLEAFEAYNFILVAAKTAIGSSAFDSATGHIVIFAKSVPDDSIVKSTESSWNGRLETLDSPARLALAYFFTVIRNPTVWNQIKAETRRSFLEVLLAKAIIQCHPSQQGLDNAPPEARFVQAWTSVVSHEYLLNAPCITGDLVQLLSEKIKSDSASRKVYVDSLQRIPARLVTRGQRGALLDVLLGVLVEQENPADVTVGILSLLAKLAEMPKSSATVTSEWHPLWNAAKAIKPQGTMTDVEMAKAFRTLHHAVMDKLFHLSMEEKQKVFKKLYRKVSTHAFKAKSIEHDSMVMFFVRITLSQLWDHRAQLAGVVEEADLVNCRSRVFGLVVGDLKSVKNQYSKQKTPETISLVKVLDLLEDFQDLATDNDEVETLLSKIEKEVRKSGEPSKLSLQKLSRYRVVAGSGSQKGVVRPAVQCIETCPLEQLFGQELQLFVRTITERFRSMASNSPSRVIEEIREADGFTDGSSAQSLLVAGLAVASLPPIDDKNSDEAKGLSSLGSTITESLHRSTSIGQFSLATECLEVFLRNHARCVTQWNIDSILASVSVCASTRGPHLSPEFSPPIYSRLCRLMGILFGLHRQKLGGRFHLILPAMQRLLGCLFTQPNNKKNQRSRHADGQSPIWLAPLPISHAVQYTRLLTSLCDPTVSAVSRPSNTPAGQHQEGLTDQTKKAKSIAGQYLQYLIMEYAQCSLRGCLSPDAKAALLPGLYAVLDVMSKDTMRALNAGLDVSARAVFKGLYDDYVKFGKWNKG